MIKKLLLLLTIAFNLNATQIQDVQTVFEKNIITVVDIVKNKQLSADDRNDKIVKILTPMFDFKLMAKISLGRVWKTMNQDKRVQFTDLYVKRMKKSYSSKIDKYTNETILVNSVKQVKKTRIVLNSSLVSTDDNLEVVYKYYKPKKQLKDKNTWLVYDVVIAGVSIIKTDKAQFKAVLQENSIDDLMQKLK